MEICTDFFRLLLAVVLLLNIGASSRGTRTGDEWHWPEPIERETHEDSDLPGDICNLSENPRECVDRHVSFNVEQDDQNNHDNQQWRTQCVRLQFPPRQLTIFLNYNSTCFKMYEYFGCNRMDGAYLQLLNVEGKKKSVLLNVVSADKERLLNFNLVPRSLQSCDKPDDEKLQREHCESSFRLEIKGTGQTTIGINGDKCHPLPKPPKDPRNKRPEAQLYIARNTPDGTICLELFSGHDCTGDRFRFVLPSSSALWEGEGHETAKIWDYFSNGMGKPVVDTDIQSVRKCSYCLSNTEEHITEISDYAKFPPSKFKPPSTVGVDQPKKESLKENECKFDYCVTILDLIKNETILTVHSDCYFYFNNTDCSTRPIVNDGLLEHELLQETITLNPYFKQWAVADCKDNQSINQSKCAATIYDTGIQDFFNKKNGAHHQNGPLFKTMEVIVLSVAGSLAVIMLIVVIIMSILLWRKKRRIRAIRQRCIPKKGQSTQQRNLTVHQIDAIEVNDYVNDITGLSALCTSFAGPHEIPRDRINIGNIRDSTACIIGVGEFSIAFKGRLEPQGKTVAVKTMKSGQATTRSIKGALRECQIFKQLGKHSGILEFLGVCTENVKSGEIYIVMAWCAKGSLRGFLAQQKSHFVSLVQDGEWVDDEKMQTALEANSFIEDGPPVKFNTIQLFKWCIEVADAMEFLAVRKIVHVSLSARNVLLDEKYTCKISDFHLAKVPGEVMPAGSFTTTMHRNLNKERLVPWRWCAVESLLDDVFSTQSDVWTYGVFMWEVFSLGALPFPEYTYGSEFTLCIKHGYRLQTPNFATVECYQLMLMCWYDAPEKRPSFTKLKLKLDEMTPRKDAPLTPGPFQVIRTLSISKM